MSKGKYEVSADIPGKGQAEVVLPEGTLVELIESAEEPDKYVATFWVEDIRADSGGSTAPMMVERSVTLTQAKVDKYLKKSTKKINKGRAEDDPNFVLTDDAEPTKDTKIGVGDDAL